MHGIASRKSTDLEQIKYLVFALIEKDNCDLQEEDEEGHELLRLTNQAFAESVVNNLQLRDNQELLL